MELRARIRPTLRRAGLMVAAVALLVPATAGTATAKSKAPVVKRITPKNVFVGETLTIRGRHFRPGLNKNTVAFKRAGAKVVLVRADKSTKKLLRVELPKRLEKVLLVQNGTPVPTPLQVRVMSTRFGKRFTSRSKSPLVGPEKPPAPPKPKQADPNGDCDGDGQANKVDADDDNDLLSDATEASLSSLLDICK
ncbi:MAG TPA: IPT/TIG domain-containing protein, partial [Vicinamibacterales bacterium]|nr:IPT/TIG domain-containing protein [Vicinamibacterales bacterium]